MGGRTFEIFLFLLHVDPPMAQTRPGASIRVWLGRLNLFWPFGPSFPFILAFWAFISFHFGLLGLHFFSFWPFGPSFPFIFGLSGLPRGVPPTSCQKRPVS